MTTTLKYYNQNALSFIEGTIDVDFKIIQNKFIDCLPQGATILDFGCGSGRDTKYFLEQGFQVTATDGSEELCKLASEYTGIPVKQMLFLELDEKDAYDGVWACSSILHCSYDDLVVVMQKISAALKNNGVLYTSFKYGTFSGERNGRFFTDMTEETFKELLRKCPELEIEDLTITTDVRPGRGEERWLNLILRKQALA
ncbi:MAG: class I SAM-dependent methyltransferase [Lachnospiraceae bacterium]|nr:class I SAM-dependent methyltransferase [Lachnospiraceae bacterium]